MDFGLGGIHGLDSMHLRHPAICGRLTSVLLASWARILCLAKSLKLGPGFPTKQLAQGMMGGLALVEDRIDGI